MTSPLRLERPQSLTDMAFERIREAIVSGAARRLRPKLMTVTAMLAGLIPILFSTGTGADVMQRMAAPMIGGIVTSFLLELLVYPSLYLWYRQRLS